MKIRINNWEYEITVVKEDDSILKMDDGYYHSGVTDLKEQKIYIQEGLNSQQLWYTVVHELTHAYLQAYGMLQIDYTDEIVADIMGIYSKDIIETANKVICGLYEEPLHIYNTDWTLFTEASVDNNRPFVYIDKKKKK